MNSVCEFESKLRCRDLKASQSYLANLGWLFHVLHPVSKPRFDPRHNLLQLQPLRFQQLHIVSLWLCENIILIPHRRVSPFWFNNLLFQCSEFGKIAPPPPKELKLQLRH